MTKNFKLVLWLIGFAIFCVIAFVSLRIPENPSKITKPAIALQPAVQPSPLKETVESKLHWGVADNSGKIGFMRAVYNSGREKEVFFQYALQHPEDGGLFYARQLIFSCAGLKSAAIGKEIGTNPHSNEVVTVSKQAQRRFDETLAGCKAFSDGRASQQLAAALPLNGDPLNAALAEVRAARVAKKMSLVVAEETMDTAVRYGDPYLLANAMVEALQFTTRFDGKLLDKQTKEELYGAIVSAKCQLGADCVNSEVVIQMCLYRGSCPQSEEEVVLNRPGIPQESRTRMIDFSHQIVASARDGTLARLFE